MIDPCAKLRLNSEELLLLLTTQEQLIKEEYLSSAEVQQAKMRFEENAQRIIRLTLENKNLLQRVEVKEMP